MKKRSTVSLNENLVGLALKILESSKRQQKVKSTKDSQENGKFMWLNYQFGVHGPFMDQMFN
jgi:hypothetical protein